MPSPSVVKKGILLVLIYLAFISLGLPDSLLGAAWPAMFEGLAVPMDYAGILSLIVAAGTVISSLFSGRVIKKFGVAAVTTASVLMTALALMGFSLSGEFLYLCLLAIPLGLGAGSVDAALNNYVALHYEARHMNWLHSFWGVGAAIGPMIMAAYLAKGDSWTSGYHTVAWIQLSLVGILLISLPLWSKGNKAENLPHHEAAPSLFDLLLTLPGLKQALIVFFCYCTIEATFGLWGASFLVFEKGFEADQAARLTSLYFLGITIGRFLSGFLTAHFSNRQLVFLGQGVIGLGLLLLFLPFTATIIPGFLLVGLGCAPIFPSLLHETPVNFGKKHSQSVMGMQMASAYVGITLMPFLFGKLAKFTGQGFLLIFLGIFLILIFGKTRQMNQKVASGKSI
ncbi:MFS transporter [Algoriphagus sp. CAU 1675]|uniref:MFS transporter n=1 Tax=Algoriphagus sp. CAU 1675 TaxID=3032597 RepID=UPI0023DC53EA|nr:MFS transporter [Algoriphagus sp. CAU 1675]MDF2157505.1 MFS transporter [Algoriphagus sp. CAU 1675]